MRNWSSAAVTIIVGVALYFALAWGIEAVGMLASPAYGLDDVWRSQVFSPSAISSVSRRSE